MNAHHHTAGLGARQDIFDRPQWINWHFVKGMPGTKLRKMPDNDGFLFGEGWMPYAVAAVSERLQGFVFTEDDPFVFIDLDNCRLPDGSWSDGAEWIYRQAVHFGAAAEISVSGTGLHIIVVADKSRLADRVNRFKLPDGQEVEVYRSGRFMALGQVREDWTIPSPVVADITIPHSPFEQTIPAFGAAPQIDATDWLLAILPVRTSADSDNEAWTTEAVAEWGGDGLSDDELIAKARQSNPSVAVLGNRAAHFADLFDGSASVLSHIFPAPGRDFDHSSADIALANSLAWWTGKNCERVRTLMLRSGLKRDKWDRHSSYLRRTIMNAVASRANADVYRNARNEARRQAQMALNAAIGEEAAPALQPVLTVEEMIRDLWFTTEGNYVIDATTKSVVRFDHAAGTFAASKHTIPATPTRKEKIVPALPIWRESPLRKTVASTTWRPGFAEVTDSPEAKSRAYNLWSGFRPSAAPEDWSVRIEPFHRHLAYLIPNTSERTRFVEWIAHILQQPGKLPHTSYLFVTTQTGIGRNWLASVLVRVLRGYVASGVDIGRALDGSFNGRLSQKLLAIVDEVREGMTDRRYQRAEALKTLITQEFREINHKYGTQSVEYNCCRWLMFSNHHDALPIDNKDRRVVVIENPEQRASPEYYRSLYALIDDASFIASVRHYLETLDLAAFNPGEHAPVNEIKTKVIEAATPETDRTLIDFAKSWSGDLATRSDIDNWLGARPNDAAITHAIRRAGMTIYRRVRINGVRENVVIVRSLTKDQVERLSGSQIATIITTARNTDRFNG